MLFDHYILTRFNLGVYDKHPNPSEWMDHRVKLFDTYTLPSMLRQTNTNWTWVLCFDEKTPDNIICKYDYIDNIKCVFERPDVWIRANADSGSWLITTRLDNDDYVERDWIGLIQEQFDGMVKVVDMNGRALDVSTGVYYDTMRPGPNSMFLSLIEPGGVCDTCYKYQHTHMLHHYDSVMLNQYGWVMVCHDMNIINSVKRNAPILANEYQVYYVN